MRRRGRRSVMNIFVLSMRECVWTKIKLLILVHNETAILIFWKGLFAKASLWKSLEAGKFQRVQDNESRARSHVICHVPVYKTRITFRLSMYGSAKTSLGLRYN